MRGKLVLVHINQRNDWWINYPAYQAHLRGAAAILAVQAGGYGEVDEQALERPEHLRPPAGAGLLHVPKRTRPGWPGRRALASAAAPR